MIARRWSAAGILMLATAATAGQAFAAPDLVVSAFTAPSSANSGQSFNVAWTLLNQGTTAASPGMRTVFYFSTDAVLDGGDTSLGFSDFNASLAAGASHSSSLTGLFLPGVAEGNYYLIAFVFKFGSSDPESDVTNNTLARPITITKPDLTPTAIGAPSSANAAQTISVSWMAQNAGTGTAAAPWRDIIWFSSDAVLGGDTLLHFNDFGVGFTVASGASYTGGPTNVTLPNVAEGTYYLIVQTDSGGQLSESNEANNTFAQPITITKPDLTPTGVGAPSSANATQTISVSWMVQNAGTGTAAAPWRDIIWFSSDAVLGGDTNLVFNDFGVGFTVASGASYTGGPYNVTLPNVAEGTYYLIVQTDSGGQLSESNEGNNTLAVPITITKPDLTPTALTAPSLVSPGQSVSVSWTIQNAGTGPSLPPWRDRVWFSTDAVLGSDTDLGFVDRGASLASGASYTQGASVTIPAVGAGSYYLIVQTDQTGQEVESDEANNTFATPIQVTTCGDGLAGGTEGCDLGVANGSATSCCTAVCQLRAAGQSCRTSAGICDVAETCTGTAPACPADAFQSSTLVCRSAAGSCDVAESCSGSGPACPADQFVASGVECRSAAGICDVAETCDGASASCPSNGFATTTVVCRAAVDVCDRAENCPGTGSACPSDQRQPSGTECRAAAGPCDVAETCDGSATACPADVLQPSSVVCRSVAGVCDLAEQCTGTSGACPADVKVASGTECRGAAGPCDVAEQCDGNADACPTDGFEPSTLTCRSAAGVCDVDELCTGSGAACPADAKRASGTECRAAAGPCDVAEQCNGSTNACPADGFQPSSVVCRSAAGVCDLVDHCTGTAAACPADGKAASGTTCREAVDDCDLAEGCDGSADACPSDALAPDGTSCEDDDECTTDQTCSSGVCAGGTAVVCPLCRTCDSAGGCMDGPKTGCKVPTKPLKAQLFLKDGAPGSDQVKWKWTTGQATTFAELGSPLTTDEYALCVYDASAALLLKMTAPADGTCGTSSPVPCWKQLGVPPKGYKYKDFDGLPHDLDGLLLKAGLEGKAKMSLKGKGINVPMPALGSFALPLTTQLQSGNGTCWQATFPSTGVKLNTTTSFKAKSE